MVLQTSARKTGGCKRLVRLSVPSGASVDGINDSSRYRVGYWVAPDNQPHAWAKVQVTPSPNIYLSDLPALDVRVHHLRAKGTGPRRRHDLCSLIIHPSARKRSGDVAFALDKNYQTLSGEATISDWAGEGSVTPLTFRIVGDGKELWRASMQKTGEMKPVNVRVSGVTKLELFVDCPGNTHAAQATWVDLELTRASAATKGSRKTQSEKAKAK